MTFKAMKFKVENPKHSEAIQRELFKQGYKWNSGDASILHTHAKAITVREDGTLSFGADIDSAYNAHHTLTTLEQLQESTKMTTPKTPRTAPLEWPADEPFPYKHLEGRLAICIATKKTDFHKFYIGHCYVISCMGVTDPNQNVLVYNDGGSYSFNLILNDDEDGVPVAPEQDIYTTALEDCTGALTVGFETPAPKEPRTSLEFLSACSAVQAERGSQYEGDDQERSFSKIATAFNAITGHNILPCEVALIQQILKDVRQWSDMTRVHTDSLLDKVSYAALTSEQVIADIEGAL
jgi:hypothetical protein